jgi:acyl carrier protein
MNHRQESGDQLFDVLFEQTVTRVLNCVPKNDVVLACTGLDSLGFLGLLMELEDGFDSLWPLEYLTISPAEFTIESLRTLTRDVLWQGGGT